MKTDSNECSKEYFITRDFDHRKPPLKEGELVSHVYRDEEESMFRFYRHSTQSNYTLHYNWGFAENNKLNRKLLKRRNSLDKKIESLKKERKEIVDQMTAFSSWS